MRADICEVAAHRLRGQYRAAVVDTAGDDDRNVSHRPDLGDEGKRVDRAGMAAGATAHGNQSVGAGIECLLGVARRGDIVEGDAAPAVNLLEYLLGCSLRGQHDSNLPLCAQRQITLVACIRRMHDEVHRIGRRSSAGGLHRGHALVDLVEPLSKHLTCSGGVGREAPHHSALAGGKGQLRRRHQKHRRRDHRYSEPSSERHVEIGSGRRRRSVHVRPFPRNTKARQAVGDDALLERARSF